MIIDTHAHFWRDPPGTNTAAPGYHAPIEVDDFVRDMDAAGVDKLLQVTRVFLRFDNSYSLEGASRYPDRIRVLGRINPRAADVTAQLAGWLRQPHMVGIRLMAVNADEASCFDDGAMDRFWPEAEKHAIPISLYAPERSVMVGEIAAQYPTLPLIVDHVGTRVFDIFARPPSLHDWPNLLALARHSNVIIKVSGLPEALVEHYPFPKSQERLRQIYDCFGPDRMMWGSNYPPTTQICTYREALALVRELCGFLSAGDRAKILGGTASRVFRLPW